MKSKVNGDEYVIIRDGEHLPFTVKKEETDEFLSKIRESLVAFQGEIKSIYEDYKMYGLLRDALEYLDIENGKSWRIDEAVYAITELEENLATNDEVPPLEELCDLSDLGYVREFYDKEWWVKFIEDSDEREVVEEIRVCKNPSRRIRTTYWEKTDYGRSSTSITYRTLPIDKKLLFAIKNTSES